MGPKVVCIVQARMGSARLPGKVLLPLGDSCLLDYVVSRCKAIEGVSDVVVATTKLGHDDEIEHWCQSRQIAVYRGSEENVLSRFLEAATPYQPDFVIRVTADNPFFDYMTTSRMITFASEHEAELVAFDEEHLIGSAAELIKYEALQRIGKHAKLERHLEHVTYYAYEFPEQFRLFRIDLPASLKKPHLRITVDTDADYALSKALATAFPSDKTVYTEEVVRYLLDHPEVMKINRHIVQKPVV